MSELEDLLDKRARGELDLIGITEASLIIDEAEVSENCICWICGEPSIREVSLCRGCAELSLHTGNYTSSAYDNPAASAEGL